MRKIILSGLCCGVLLQMVGCGQSGALILPENENPHKPAHYMIPKYNKQHKDLSAQTDSASASQVNVEGESE